MLKTNLKKNKNKTNVALIIDASGSMSGIKTKALSAFNQLLNNIKTSTDHRTELSVYSFGDNVSPIIEDVNIENVRDLNSNEYQINGMTALFDAVGHVLEKYSKSADYNDPNCAFLIMVVTDGGENVSRSWTGTSLTKKIIQVHKTGRFTLTFSVPDQNSVRTLDRMGIPTDNIQTWTQDDIGIYEMEQKTSEGIGNYFQSRSRGITASSAFYCQTNADNIKSKDLKQMQDVSNIIKSHTVNIGEIPIKDFVEQKTHKPYVIGEAYYQLSKTEKIQPQKELIIFDKNTNKYYNGDNARQLLGLPVGQLAKVTPGNHSHFDIFVQSTSVNRKLVRGTKVLVIK